MKDFDPDPCIELWWKAKSRRPDQQKRKEYRKRTAQDNDSENSNDESEAFILDDWDNWLDHGESRSVDM